MADNAKMCPLMAAGLGIGIEESIEDVKCREAACAWWHDGECAMRSIASSLNDLSKNGIRVSPTGLVGGLK